MELIKSRYPQLNMSKIEFNKTDGSYSDIAIVNNEVVFKFAKYDWSAVYLRNEADVIRFIRDYVTLPLPDVEMIEPNVTKHNYIKGSPLYRNLLLRLDYHTQDTVAGQIATFLNQLHSISVKKARYAGVEDSLSSRTREDWLAEIETIQRKIFPFCTDYAKEYFRQIIQPAVSNEKFFEFRPALIHGDLTPNHILFDKTSRNIGGIIGFGNAGIGDPAYDFGILLDHLGENFIRRVHKYYPIPRAYMDRARFYAYMSSYMWYRDICDMIATRDFSRLQFPAKDRDIYPMGTMFPGGKG